MSREPSGIRLDYAEEEKNEEDTETDVWMQYRPDEEEQGISVGYPSLSAADYVETPTPLTFHQERIDLDASVFSTSAQQQQQLNDDDDGDHYYENPNDAFGASVVKEQTSRSVYPPTGAQAPCFKDQVQSRTRATVSHSNSNHKQQPSGLQDAEFIEQDNGNNNPPIVDAYLPHAVVVETCVCPSNKKYMICFTVSVFLLLVTALVVGLIVGLSRPQSSSQPLGEQPTISPTTINSPTTTSGSGTPLVLVDGGDMDGGTVQPLNNDGTYNVVANPLPDSINSSDHVIEYTRNGDSEFDNIGYSFSFDEPDVFLSGEKVFAMDLYTKVNPGTKIWIQLENSATATADNWPMGVHSACSAQVGANNNLQWETIRFDGCYSPDPQVKTVDTLVIFFDEGNLSSGKYYFDNLLVRNS